MNSLREKLTYANVVATIALFLVVAGGTAFAAVKLPKNSVGAKQLKKNSVGAKQLKKGAVTPAKLAAATRSSLAGPTGPQGQRGKVGPRGNEGKVGPRGQRGEPGPAVQILPSGQTETGVWAGAAPAQINAPINFFPRLPAPVAFANEVYMKVGETNSTCQGFGKAAPGQLCVYGVFEHEADFVGFLGPESSSFAAPSSTSGTVVYFDSKDASANARGNWAYTAP